MILRRNAIAEALENALSGRTGREAAPELAALAAELRNAGLAVPQPHVSLERREELRAAVLARSAERRRTGGPGRVRGATLGVAAVAGAGLVVASAASGSNPAVLVAEVAREFPRMGLHAAPPTNLSIEGEVVATYNEGRTLEVRSHGETFVVESPSQTRAVTIEGTPVAASAIEEGANVRVTTDRNGDSGVVTAKKIEVLPPTLAAETRTPLAAVTDSKTPTPAKDANAGTNSTPQPSTPTRTPTPGKTRTPTPSKTPLPDVTSVVIAPVEPIETPKPTVTPVPTKTPTPRPKETATTVPYQNSVGNVDAADGPKSATDY